MSASGATFWWQYSCQAGQAIQAINALQTASSNLTASAGGSQAAVAGIGSSARSTIGHIDGMTGAINKFLIAAGGVRAVTALLGDYGKAVREAREHGEKMGAGTLGKKERLRELAAVMGENEVNDRVTSQVFNVGLKSGLSFNQSDEFLKGLYGSIPAGIKKGNIKQEQIPEVAEEAARATVRFGLDAYVGGDFAGAIAQHVNLNNQRDAKGNLMTAREAMAAQFGGGVFAANEGRGAVSSLVKEELKTAATSLTSGRLADMAEVGGFIQAASTISKTGAFAGTKFSQLDSALNHQAGVGDKFGDFLKEIGVADAKGDRAKLEAFKAHLDQVKPDDAEAYLAQHGLKQREERKSLIGFAANVDVVTKGIDQTREVIRHPEAQIKANAAFQATQVGRFMQSKVGLEKAEFETGKRHAEFDIAARNALAQLEQEGALDDAGIRLDEELRDAFGFQKLTGAPEPLQRMVMRRMAQNIETAIPDARKQGLTTRTFGNLSLGDQLRYLGTKLTGDSVLGPGGKTGAEEILDQSEPALPTDPKAAAAALDRAVKLNPAAARGRQLNIGPVIQGRAPAAAQPRAVPAAAGAGPAGAAGAAGVPGPQAALGELRGVIDALRGAADAHTKAADAHAKAAGQLAAANDTFPDFGYGGYGPYRDGGTS